jgi:hypothetical protein
VTGERHNPLTVSTDLPEQTVETVQGTDAPQITAMNRGVNEKEGLFIFSSHD